MDVRSFLGSWRFVGSIVTVAGVSVGAALWVGKDVPDTEAEPFEKLYAVDVKRVYSGHKVKIDPDGHLTYAGIRAPYSDEPLFDEAMRRNEELVLGKRIRVRYEEGVAEKDGHLHGYAFVGGVFVNETLVREGLAYVRLTFETERYNERLLSAQREAQRARRGLWRRPMPKGEKQFFADPKYGNFHRPDCEETPKIKPERLTTFNTRAAALGRGFAPCRRCNP